LNSVLNKPPLKVDTALGIVTRTGTMYNQAELDAQQRARGDYSCSGTQHLPAHSVVLRVQHKSTRLRAGSEQLTVKLQPDTGTPLIYRPTPWLYGRTLFLRVQEKSSKVRRVWRRKSSHTHLGFYRSHGAWTLAPPTADDVTFIDSQSATPHLRLDTLNTGKLTEGNCFIKSSN
ncbi:hypothetical protein GOODEAATRI_010076, partial [Goodea atripinnis]